jgi:RNA polymerase sigma-70 factor (ECF subfamily)
LATDREIFLELVDQHGASTMGMLRRLCGSSHDAEDIFQDVALRVWRTLGSRPRLRNARAWLFTIAYHAYLDHQTRSGAQLSLLETDEPARGGLGHDPVVIAERLERCQLLEAAVMELSPPLRSVIVMHYTGSLSLREVAGVLGISVGTVKSRLNAGLEQLRGRMT